MNLFILKILLVTIMHTGGGYAVIGQDKYPVPTGNSNQLFYLQRTQNTNTIVYELNYSKGILDLDNPVREFWIRYQENGQREELSYIQRKFAYGIKTKKIGHKRYELRIVAYKKYKMYLEQGPGNKLQVYTTIDNKKAILTSIFLKMGSGGSFWSPDIEYVEVTGIEPVSRAVVKERLKI